MSEKVKKKIRRANLNPELSDFTVTKDNIDDLLKSINKEERKEDEPLFIVIDLFCGAGGTTYGFVRLGKIIKVVACINHDFFAIKSHWKNHPDVAHFEEDVRLLNVHLLKKLLDHYRVLYPHAKFILWASLECTNFSKAKGGQQREADSRTLAQALYMVWDETIIPESYCYYETDLKGVTHRFIKEDCIDLPRGGYVEGDSYMQILKPDYLYIENVVEFMSWGPLDDDGKPISKKNGNDWLKWRKDMCALGYHDDWKEINSADMGAYTSRNRLFGVFAKKGLPTSWPLPTHAKVPGKESDLFGRLEKWQAVKEVLDFKDEGASIFINLVPTVAKGKVSCKQKAILYLTKKLKKEPEVPKQIVIFPAAMKDVCYGMEPKLVICKKDVKRVDKFVAKYCKEYGLAEEDLAYYRYDPFSEKTLERVFQGLIKFVAGGKKNFMAKTYAVSSNGHGTYPTDVVAHTITTRDSHNLVQPIFISKYNGGNPESRNTSIDEPCRTVTTENRHALVQASFISKYNSGHPESKNISLEGPAGTVTTVDHHALVQPCFIQKHFSGRPEGKVISVDGPAGTICTVGNQSLVQPQFLQAYYSTGDNNHSLEGPAPTIRTRDGVAIISPVPAEPCFIDKQYSNGDNTLSLDSPAGTIMTNDKHALVSATHFIDRPFSGGGQNSSVEAPAGAIMGVPKLNLVTADKAFVMPTNYNNQPTSIDDPSPVITANRKWHYIVNPSWGGNPSDTNLPCPVVVARQDKAPLYLVGTEAGEVGILIYEDDTPGIKKIKEFMAMYGIVDIKMRMLKVRELLRIQGFPETYTLCGSLSDQKKQIGNSVETTTAMKLAEALVMVVFPDYLIKLKAA